MEQEQPIEPEQRNHMKLLARFLDEQLNPDMNNKKWGFAFLVFKFGQGEDHRANYVSNCTRDTMIATMKELIARWEGRHTELINPTIKQ